MLAFRRSLPARSLMHDACGLNRDCSTQIFRFLIVDTKDTELRFLSEPLRCLFVTSRSLPAELRRLPGVGQSLPLLRRRSAAALQPP